MQGEIRELLTNYGKIDVLWFDCDGANRPYDQATTYPLVKKLQPKILLNNRLDLDEGNSDRQIVRRTPTSTRPSSPSAAMTTSARGNPA